MNPDFQANAREVLERQGVRQIAQRMAADRGLAGQEAENFVSKVFEECVEGLAIDLRNEAEGEAASQARKIMEA